MIEVLVAMLVLAVGILGFASLQLSSTSTNLEAYLRVPGTCNCGRYDYPDDSQSLLCELGYADPTEWHAWNG